MKQVKKKKKTESDTSLELTNENLWRPLYPFESHYLRIGGLSCHYLDEGPDDVSIGNGEGVPVLLLSHGNPTWTFYWRNIIKAFSDRYRVVAIDHLGCGLSDKPGDDEYEFTLERRISDLTVLIKKLNLQNITLIAHDWGGAIGMGAAARLSKRFSRFVLMNTGAYLSEFCPFRIRLCRIPFVSRLIVQGLNGFAGAAVHSATTVGLSKAVRAGLLAPYSNWQNRTAVYRFVQDIPLSEKHVSYQTLKEVQNGLSLFRDSPVSLIWGMQDWCFTPAFLKKFLQFFPEAEVNRIARAGHYVVEDAPDEVINYIDEFLKKHPS